MKTAIIIGAGPAGLTAAYELLKQTDIIPIVLEKDDCVGGIARTVNHNGYRIDIGGHRFFSKSDRVMDWWLQFLPLEKTEGSSHQFTYQNKTTSFEQQGDLDPDIVDNVMLIRSRKSRIFYNRKFFDYPISLSIGTIANLGLWRTIKIGLSYIKASLFPIKNEQNLEEFFINRFGKELYGTFFKDYTEKVWVKECHEISAEFGAQRVKGLSITSAIAHALKALLPSRSKDIRQKNLETSLIEQFLYPKYGPGHLWEVVKDEIERMGGKVIFNTEVVSFSHNNKNVDEVHAINTLTQEKIAYSCDHVFSTMPVKQLIHGLGEQVPSKVSKVADGLAYRDFLTVGLLLNKFKPGTKTIDDNWIYIQEPDVKVGRLQIFNNWSPYMVKDASKVWIGLEYFCNVGDDLWNLTNEELISLAGEELAKIGLVDKQDVTDGVVIRMPKTYPAYFGTYDQMHQIIDYTSAIKNLWLIGRNGMHKYNNQDHSMLTAMTAVENIAQNSSNKSNIWAVNTEQEYHEEK